MTDLKSVEVDDFQTAVKSGKITVIGENVLDEFPYITEWPLLGVDQEVTFDVAGFGTVLVCEIVACFI